MKSKNVLISGALVLAALVAFLVSYQNLPQQVPIHWDSKGSVNGYGPRYALLLLGPGLMLSEMLLFALLPRLSPKRFEVDSFKATYLHLMLILVSMTGYFFAIVLWASLTGSVDVISAILGGASAFTILLGNVMGKVRRNFFIGIRTPWTLASERVWYATHRVAGKLLVITGIIGLVLALLGTSAWLWLAVLGAGLSTLVAYSLYFYKSLEKRGELDVSA